MPDQAICGYGRAEGMPCRELREGRWCSTHEQARFRVCVGCTKEALRECAVELSPGNFCGLALCNECNHGPDDVHGTHDWGPPQEPPAQGLPSPTPESRAQLDALREELTTVVAGILADCEEKNLIVLTRPASADAVAAKIMRDLPTHITVKLLSALGATP